MKEKFINGKRYILSIGDVWVHESKRVTQEVTKMNKKTAVKNTDKKVIAAGIIKQIKEQYVDWTSGDRCKLFATLYTMSLKEKKAV